MLSCVHFPKKWIFYRICTITRLVTQYAHFVHCDQSPICEESEKISYWRNHRMHLPMRLQRRLSHIILWGKLEIWNAITIDLFLLLLDISYDSFPLTVACLVNAYSKVQHWSFQFRLNSLTTFVCVGNRSWEGILNRDEVCLCGLGCLQTFGGLERPDAEGDVPPQKYLWHWRVSNPNRVEHTDSAEIFPLIGKTVYFAGDCCLGTCCWNGRSKATLAKFCIIAQRRHECAEFSVVNSRPSGGRSFLSIGGRRYVVWVGKYISVMLFSLHSSNKRR